MCFALQTLWFLDSKKVLYEKGFLKGTPAKKKKKKKKHPCRSVLLSEFPQLFQYLPWITMTSTNGGSATKKQRTKLASLRDELINEGIDAFIVGSGDPHQSEYVAESDMRRPFISDFSGSAGTALILQDKALLWTDGRYFLQASQQLSQEWTLMKSGEPGVLEMQPWLVANLKQEQTVGVDAFLISAQEAKRLKEALAVKGIVLKVVAQNPVDKVWDIDGSRPAAPSNPIRVHDTMYAGATHAEKIQQVQSYLRSTGATALVLSMLDEIVWLYNIRGSDVDYNPVVIAYAVITLTDAHLFVDLSKVPPSSAAAIHLSAAHIATHPYESIESFLSSSFASPQKVVLDPAQLNWRLYNAVATPCVLEQPSPCTLWKALKCPAEMAGIRACHIRDGAALTAFLCWLEKTVASGSDKVTEYDAAMMLESYRAKASPGLHMGPSFDTIAGFGSNGAIIHYKPAQDTTALLVKDTEGSMFLLDSGGQYLDGTTDVTRTVHFGTPSSHMKRCYTAVLQGHIALATAVFPEGTIGSRIDCLAR